MPLEFRLFASWLGKQMMSLPPPPFFPARVCYEFHNLKKDSVPESFLSLYLAIMSLRNNGISWNSLMSACFQTEVQMDLERLDALGAQIPCHMILGEGDPYLTDANAKLISDKFGTDNLNLGYGHTPWFDDPQGIADALVKILLETS